MEPPGDKSEMGEMGERGEVTIHIRSESKSGKAEQVPRIIRTLSGRLLPFPSEESCICPICLEPMSNDSSTLIIVPCQHGFCLSCFQKYLETNILEAKVPLKCPLTSCGAKLVLTQITELLSEEMNKKLQHFQALKDEPTLRECSSCHKLIKPGPDSKTSSLTCSCGHVFCATHGDSHPGQNCSDYALTRSDSWHHREVASGEAIKAISKHCPTCSQPIEKVKGTCDHVRCPACGVDFCYKCLNPRLTGTYNRKCEICNHSFIDHKYMPCWRVLAILLFPLWFPVALVWMALILILISVCILCVVCGLAANGCEACKGFLLVLFLPFILVLSYTGTTQCMCLMPEEIKRQMAEQ